MLAKEINLEQEDFFGSGRGVSMPCQNVCPSRMSYISSFYYYLPSLSFRKPHHPIERFSINCFIFWLVCVAEAEKFRPLWSRRRVYKRSSNRWISAFRQTPQRQQHAAAGEWTSSHIPSSLHWRWRSVKPCCFFAVFFFLIFRITVTLLVIHYSKVCCFNRGVNCSIYILKSLPSGIFY